MNIEKKRLQDGTLYYEYATRSRNKLTGAVSIQSSKLLEMIGRMAALWKR